MMSGILSRTDLLTLPLMALGVFMGVFVGAIAWIYRPGSAAVYRERARMVLDAEREDAHVEP